jgi:hypothetical protein
MPFGAGEAGQYGTYSTGNPADATAPQNETFIVYFVMPNGQKIEASVKTSDYILQTK